MERQPTPEISALLPPPPIRGHRARAECGLAEDVEARFDRNAPQATFSTVGARPQFGNVHFAQIEFDSERMRLARETLQVLGSMGIRIDDQPARRTRAASSQNGRQGYSGKGLSGDLRACLRIPRALTSMPTSYARAASRISREQAAVSRSQTWKLCLCSLSGIKSSAP